MGPTHGGMAQAEWTWVSGYVPRWFTRPKMVTHPGTDRAWHYIDRDQRVTTKPKRQPYKQTVSHTNRSCRHIRRALCGIIKSSSCSLCVRVSLKLKHGPDMTELRIKKPATFLVDPSHVLYDEV